MAVGRFNPACRNPVKHGVQYGGYSAPHYSYPATLIYSILIAGYIITLLTGIALGGGNVLLLPAGRLYPALPAGRNPGKPE